MSATLLEESLNNFDFFWTWLQKATSNSRHPFRYPTVVTSLNGIPSARTMVLRDVVEYQLIFFTDIRSPKVREIKQNPHLCIHIYDSKKRTQIIVKGTSSIIQNHSKMKIWKDSGRRRPNDYTSSQLPSHPLSEHENIEFIKNSFDEHFGVLSVDINCVEILHLQKTMHQRWCWKRKNNGENWQKTQIVP